MAVRKKIPVLAVTMGDLAGVGPEITVKTLLGARKSYGAAFVIIGDAGALEAACAKAIISRRPKLWEDKAAGAAKPGDVFFLAKTHAKPRDIRMGVADKRWGHASVEYIRCATELAMAGRVDGMVTAPISKEAMHKAGHDFEGHTDLLAHLSGTKEVRMMFLGPKMKVILVTVHIALREVPDAISADSIFETIRLGGHTLQSLGVKKPAIVVCAVNPHAGEAGAFGDEDDKKVRPAVLAATRLGWNVRGPIPADSFFYRALKGGVDLIVTTYHDQGLIPFKMLHFDRGVNYTAGLPFVRTSPDHGTAYDIAGKGVADTRSMEEALRWAIRLSRVPR